MIDADEAPLPPSEFPACVFLGCWLAAIFVGVAMAVLAGAGPS